MSGELLASITLDTKKMAVADFERARQRAIWRDWFSRLTRKKNRLLPLDSVRRNVGFKGQHSLGLKTVATDKIVGSEARYAEFDRTFLPLQNRTKQRWVSIDTAYYEDISLPPVELIKIGELYFVTDGNHRISVARTRGQEFIDAVVIQIDTPALVPADVWS